MKYYLAIFSSLLFSAALAQAQEKPFDWSACKVEVAKYCKEVKGNEKIYSCLEEHDKDLSPTCDATHGKFEEMTGKGKK